MDKDTIIKKYNLSKRQVGLIDTYLEDLNKTNQNINLVGSSTLNNPWDRHINDSLQLSMFILNKRSSIIDLGTGAGLPGLILTIYGYSNVLLIDSKLKKIKFIRDYSTKNKLSVKTSCSRVESLKDQKFDFVVSRAFASLSQTLHYSLIFSKKNTSYLFLKGRNVKNEILDAKKYFKFNYRLFESQSNGGGYIVKINGFTKL